MRISVVFRFVNPLLGLVRYRANARHRAYQKVAAISPRLLVNLTENATFKRLFFGSVLKRDDPI